MASFRRIGQADVRVQKKELSEKSRFLKKAAQKLS
jgi:hypothetical protein